MRFCCHSIYIYVYILFKGIVYIHFSGTVARKRYLGICLPTSIWVRTRVQSMQMDSLYTIWLGCSLTALSRSVAYAVNAILSL